jgi:hypothetical protein
MEHMATSPADRGPHLEGVGGAAWLAAVVVAVAIETWTVVVAPVPVITAVPGLKAQVLPAGRPPQLNVTEPMEAPTGVSRSWYMAVVPPATVVLEEPWTVSWKSAPEPLRATVRGADKAVAETWTVPLTRPAVCGTNITPIAQLAPGARDTVQPLLAI